MIESEDLRGNYIIDSRDVNRRLNACEEYRSSAEHHNQALEPTASDAAWKAPDGTVFYDGDKWDEGLEMEYQQLKALKEDCSHPSWDSGIAFRNRFGTRRRAAPMVKITGAANAKAATKNGRWGTKS